MLMEVFDDVDAVGSGEQSGAALAVVTRAAPTDALRLHAFLTEGVIMVHEERSSIG